MQRFPNRDTFRIMFEKKPHRFKPHQIVRWAPYPGFDHDVIIIKQSRVLGFLPSYTIKFIECGSFFFGILDADMRHARADLDNRTFPPLL